MGQPVRAIIRDYPLPLLSALGLVAGAGLWLTPGTRTAADWCWLAVVLGGGGPLLWKTLRDVLRGHFAADVVAALAIVTSLVLDQYFAGAVVVLMQSGGEALERRAFARASDSLEALLARAPRIAHRHAPEGIVDVPVDAVAPGDRLLIRPGDLVPVDATVLEGSSAVDQSALTGEPVPVQAGPGTPLMSGSINLDGALTVRADKASSESQYQRIVQLVESARRERAPLQRLADRYAAWFTPVTLLACGVAWLVTRDPTSILAVLVVATPCPLILATPVAVIGAISRVADLGVIVKTGAAIEQLGRAHTFVFDKTGTLTLGHPTVRRVHPRPGESAAEMLRLAAAVEDRSSHHLARAVVDAARHAGAGVPLVTSVREWPGSGVEGDVAGHRVLVGSPALAAEHGVHVPDADAEETTACVLVDGRLAGTIEFADRLRHQVPALMQRLAVLGVSETVMLTGDREAAAQAIAAQAGIRTVRAGLLPAQKVTEVLELKKRDPRRVLVMVGDGINDAPALAAATVGIALGAHGVAASAEAADIVVLVDDVARVGDTMAVSQRMRRIALQSILAGLGVSSALMAVAATGHLAPPIGALLQEALDVAVILNALRVRRG
ncbi:MAG TPA: heavy metal translocating P-type ATPase [Gemmatimonadales bacterium]|nr:heavy metal translocating P-type ATPase [Gemmatimonadales bacterium]